MRMGLDPRRTAVEASPFIAPRVTRARRSGLALLAIALGGFALTACDAHIPMPDTALLKPQPAPKCEARTESEARRQPVAPTDGGGDKLKGLDYEAQCYRHAEMIARNRLGKLQDSIQQSAKAVKRGASASANP